MVGRPFQDQAAKKSAASVLTDPFLLSEGSPLPGGELLYEKAHGSENGGQLLTGSGEEVNLTDNLVNELESGSSPSLPSDENPAPANTLDRGLHAKH